MTHLLLCIVHAVWENNYSAPQLCVAKVTGFSNNTDTQMVIMSNIL